MPVTEQLQLGRGFSLPAEAVTETFGILAVKRSGKSNAAVVLAEEFFDAGLPWVAVDPKGDWYGVRSSGDGHGPGLPVVVFGGAHGDVPLEPTAGRLVGDLVVDERLTCVLDVSEMTKADMRRFLHDFADRLYRRNDEPLHVFCEEADEYIPQMVRGESARVVGAFETLVKRGGFKGIGVTLVTQRSASLNKDVLTQCGSLFVLRTTSPQDRKAIEGWVKYHAAAEDALAQLAGLENGEAFFYSPQFQRTLSRVQFRQRRTFDSAATPKVGGKPRPPARLADVDLAAIKDAMAETIERAKADDPAELRKQIRRLEAELAAAPSTRPPEPIVERVEVPVVTDEVTAALHGLYDRATETLAEVAGKVGELCRLVEAHRDRQDVPGARPAGRRAGAMADGRRAGRTAERADPPGRRDAGRAPVSRPASTSGGLAEGERRVLTAAAQHRGGVTREQLSVLTGYKRSSRDTYLQRLRSRGLVDVGPTIQATPAGVDALGDDFEPLPTGSLLREHWLDRLPAGEGHVLRVLVEAYPLDVHRDDLSDATGYKRSSRDTYLQRLKARQLVTMSSSGFVRAAVTLFDAKQ